MEPNINRKFFIESSLESVEAIFFQNYHRLFSRIERIIVRFVMFKYGVFLTRTSMEFCSDIFESKEAIKNLGLVCRIRPE